MEFNESDLEGVQFMELEWKFEKGKVIPLGKMVTVNNHKMHIYINGGGANTLIFSLAEVLVVLHLTLSRFGCVYVLNLQLQ